MSLTQRIVSSSVNSSRGKVRKDEGVQVVTLKVHGAHKDGALCFMERSKLWDSDYMCKQQGDCGGRESLLVQRRTRYQKVASSSPGRSGGRILFFRFNFLC